MNAYTRLARAAIETYLREGKIILPPEKIPAKMKKRTGVFVSIHKKDGSLRGCIGTFLPTTENIACEIIRNALAAATEDPRFSPVSTSELEGLVYSIDVLSKLKTANTLKLAPKKYGLIVSTTDGRRGLLLPDISGVETKEEQIAICRLKAGVRPDEKIHLQTFTVSRHAEK